MLQNNHLSADTVVCFSFTFLKFLRVTSFHFFFLSQCRVCYISLCILFTGKFFCFEGLLLLQLIPWVIFSS